MKSNQKFNAENQVTRPCVAVLIIFNSFPCRGITGMMFNQRVALHFSILLPYSGAQTEALRTVMIFTAAVGVAKTINFSYTNTLSTCPIYVGFRPTALGSSFCITNTFLLNDIKNLIVKL